MSIKRTKTQNSHLGLKRVWVLSFKASIIRILGTDDYSFCLRIILLLNYSSLLKNLAELKSVGWVASLCNFQQTDIELFIKLSSFKSFSTSHFPPCRSFHSLRTSLISLGFPCYVSIFCALAITNSCTIAIYVHTHIYIDR